MMTNLAVNREETGILIARRAQERMMQWGEAGELQRDDVVTIPQPESDSSPRKTGLLIHKANATYDSSLYARLPESNRALVIDKVTHDPKDPTKAQSRTEMTAEEVSTLDDTVVATVLKNLEPRQSCPVQGK